MKTIPSTLQQTRDWLPSIALVAATLVLAGCGDKPLPPAPSPPPPKLFQQDRDALDKAKGVEQTEAKSADDLKREEEKQTK